MSVILRENVPRHEEYHDVATDDVEEQVIDHDLTPRIRGTTPNDANPATIAVMVPVTVP